MKSGTTVSVRVTLPARTIEYLEKLRESLGWSDEQLMTEVVRRGVKDWKGESKEF